MKRVALLFALAAACSGSYKAPPAVPTIPMPAGAALKPFDAAHPGLARPAQMVYVNGSAYVSLQNYDDSYTVRGPGLLAVLNPSTGAVSTIDLGGATGKQCLYPYQLREAAGKLYVSCTGDAFGTGEGSAIIEVDPATAKVTRAFATPVPTAGLGIATGRIWFADATSSHLYAIDRSSFTQVAGPIDIPCAATTTDTPWVTTSDVIVAQGDVYAACSNTTGGVLARFDAGTGALKGQTDAGPLAIEFTETGDGRIAIVSGGDNKLRLVTIGPATLTTAEAYTFSDQTSTLQDIRARDQFLFTVASGSNTVQKLDLTKTGGQMLVGEANVGQGATPYSILPLDDDEALIANQGNNTVVSVSADCSGGKVCWSTGVHPGSAVRNP